MNNESINSKMTGILKNDEQIVTKIWIKIVFLRWVNVLFNFFLFFTYLKLFS
jgi:hypothetical protein